MKDYITFNPDGSFNHLSTNSNAISFSLCKHLEMAEAAYIDETTGIEYYLEAETGYYYFWDDKAEEYRYYEEPVKAPPSTTEETSNGVVSNRNIVLAGASSRDVSVRRRESSTSVARRKTSRIDPRQIPRPVTYASNKEKQRMRTLKENDETSAATSALGETYYTCSGSIPPSAGIDFAAIDEGNANPKFMRATMLQIPETSELLEETHLSIGVIVQPLAYIGSDESVPTVECGEDGPIRCDRCGAYMNPFNTFTDNGSKFQCSFCGMSNAVPHDYVCNTDANGMRRDRDERFELHKGSVEYLAPSYADFPATDPSYLFVLDVSCTARISGLFQSSVQAVLNILPILSELPRCRMGIVTFDSSVHFYELRVESSDPRLVVLSDVDEAFLPIPAEQILVKPSDPHYYGLLEQVLGFVLTLYGESRETGCAFGAAAGIAALVLKDFGGKAFITQSGLPSVGIGKLEDREDPSLSNTRDEISLFHSQDSYYQILATSLAESFISVDLFVGASTSYVDLATCGMICRETGGQVFHYPGFDGNKDGYSFESDLYRAVTRETGFQASMAMRTSFGLQVGEQFGNYFKKDPGQLDLPTIDSDKAFAFRIAHEGKLPKDSKACFQAALLYTNSAGERRIRVHTLSLSTTSSISQIFRHADIDAIVNLSLRQALKVVMMSSVPEARKYIREGTVDILHIYRKRCALTTSSGQLILPEALKLLPLYTLGMLKNPILADSSSTDQRMHLFDYVNMMPVSVSVPFCYPRVYSLHELPQDTCVPKEDGSIVIPPIHMTTAEFLEDDGVYLMDTGLMFGLLFGADCHPMYMQSLFGVDSLDQTELYECHIYPDENNPNSLGSKVFTLMEKLQATRPAYCSLRVFVRSMEFGEAIDFQKFALRLIEDEIVVEPGTKTFGHPSDRMSYVEFLCWTHRKIQDKVL